ncbi:hypothetical protein [Actinomadura formosensis]|uniref:hypothetical protein n=1 Tax=Actinomadura formosensis TaxID=60706 RepID=UPI003D8CFD2F
MTEPPTETDPIATAQHLRKSYDKAEPKTTVPDPLATPTIVTSAAINALRAAVHSQFPPGEENSERADAIVDALADMASEFAMILDRLQPIAEAGAKVWVTRDAYEQSKRLKVRTGRSAAEVNYKKAIEGLRDANPSRHVQSIARELWSAVGASISALAEGLQSPAVEVRYERTSWHEDPALVGVLHEVVKAVHAANNDSGPSAQLIGSVRKQLLSLGVVVVDELRTDTALCFDVLDAVELPAGETRVEEPALARNGPEGRLVPLHNRKGVVYRGPIQMSDKESS